ncbi:MAG: hypothetical protein AAGJ11_00465 [Bacteroidota bacterium]
MVDWSRLHFEWKPDGQEPLWSDLAESEDPWVVSPQAEPSTSAYGNSEIGEVFWGIPEHLGDAEQQALGDFLSAFALSLREEDEDEVYETPLEIERTGNMHVASALSPDTVERYLALVERIPMARVVEVADNVIEESGSNLEGGESFREFIAQWVSVLNEAKARKYGVLVCLSG